MRRRSFLGVLSAATVGTSQTADVGLQNRPRVAGALSLRARKRADLESGRSKTRISENMLRWEVAQTAIVICDMWNTHTCSLSAQRVAALAPRMNQVISAARSLGVMIVHAPSDTMKFYEGIPGAGACSVHLRQLLRSRFSIAVRESPWRSATSPLMTRPAVATIPW